MEMPICITVKGKNSMCRNARVNNKPAELNLQHKIICEKQAANLARKRNGPSTYNKIARTHL